MRPKTVRNVYGERVRLIPDCDERGHRFVMVEANGKLVACFAPHEARELADWLSRWAGQQSAPSPTPMPSAGMPIRKL